ncbi:hypothetical protein CJ030_MR7G013486 [Morella rubra]|uniref:Uncharacterized protein n=1 Tax=Morella rubra TaxID=262757 RepID=A0A6A1V4J2_9ROSI|nr:hypothetical protein CJ030_MR7G013486 [Morella rubra]
MVWKFYSAILQATNLKESSMEVIVYNVQITFSLDELARFLGYERNLTAFPNLLLSDEDRPTKAEIFWTLLARIWLSWRAATCNTVVQGQPIDMASYIYQTVRVEAMKTDLQILLPYDVLLTQFLHAMLVPKSADEPKTLPLGSINKPTHEMVNDINSRLTALERKVENMDSEWKEVAAVQSILKGMAISVELLALTENFDANLLLSFEYTFSIELTHSSFNVGGKRLPCDSSVRAESTPSTLAVLGPSLRDRNELLSYHSQSSRHPNDIRIRHIRGSTRRIALLEARIGEKLTIHIPDGLRAVMTWHPQCSQVILVRSFDSMSHLKRRRSAINKENRAKLKIVHTSGVRSFQHARALLEKGEAV